MTEKPRIMAKRRKFIGGRHERYCPKCGSSRVNSQTHFPDPREHDCWDCGHAQIGRAFPFRELKNTDHDGNKT